MSNYGFFGGEVAPKALVVEDNEQEPVNSLFRATQEVTKIPAPTDQFKKRPETLELVREIERIPVGTIVSFTPSDVEGVSPEVSTRRLCQRCRHIVRKLEGNYDIAQRKRRVYVSRLA